MTSSRRKEPFRYKFTVSESCLFQITELNGVPLATKPAPAELLDWHKSGCKLATALDLRVAQNQVTVTLDFPFAEEETIAVTGNVRWQLPDGDRFLYGVEFEIDDTTKERIKIEIRRLASLNKIQAD